MKIALYQSLQHDWMIVVDKPDGYENNADYVRISEIQEIEFKMLPGQPRDSVLAKKIALAEDSVTAAKSKLKALQDDR